LADAAVVEIVVGYVPIPKRWLDGFLCLVEDELLEAKLTNVWDQVWLVGCTPVHLYNNEHFDEPNAQPTRAREMIPNVHHFEASQDLVKARLEQVAAGENK
jgi:hypothetical protein